MTRHDDGADASARDAGQFWEDRYAESDRVWSGRPNQVMVDIVSRLPAGRVLELGCGEGGDAIWLAQQGWRVTAVDISPTAIRRAEQHARDAGVPEGQIEWIATDLATWPGEGTYDLVTASFLQSWFEFPRTEILRRAAGLISAGGHLLVVAHAEPPPWAGRHHDHEHQLLTPRDELAQLDLPDTEWDVVTADIRSREATGPDGQRGNLRDGIALVRRRP